MAATTFIFGHKNPDTDSVCSSIALSYLKNRLGEKTVPKVLGNINNESRFVLDYFKVDYPSYLNDVKVRIKNIKYDKKAFIYEYASIDKAFKLMQKENITAIPLVDENKKLSGYVTLKEIAKYLINGNKEKIFTTFNNIVETLDAKVIMNFDEKITGKILVAGMQSKTFHDNIHLSSDNILIVGDRYKILDYAIDSKVKLIILPLNSTINKKLLAKAEKNGINIIETSYDSYTISNKMLLSNYIKNININTSPVTVLNEDYYSDFKQMSHKINHTNYPVLNNKGECLGLIRLTGPNTYEKQRVILVDHNNLAQSVEGIEEADICEIIDHHNLGAIGTTMPINFRSKPVGCTSTMLYEIFMDEKVAIPKEIAGIMLSAILSDTLLFTSPTTTETDKMVAQKLAKLAKVNIDKYGLEMLKAASSISDMSIEEVITSDFKSFNLDTKMLGIGQVITLDIDYVEKNKDKFIAQLDKMVEEEYSLVVLFITDIIKNGSYVLYSSKAEAIVKDAFGLEKIHEGIFIPKVVSRKKQMLPSILASIETNTIE